MTTKNISPVSEPVAYILLPTSSEDPKFTTKFSKTRKSKGSFLKTQDSVRNPSKQPPGNCGYYFSNPKNFYSLDLYPLAGRKFLSPELQTYVPIPNTTEIYIPEDSTARHKLIYQACGFRKNINPVFFLPRNTPTASVMKIPFADTMRVPSATVMKSSSTHGMKVPSASAMKLSSAIVMKVPSASSAMKASSADAMKVPVTGAGKRPSADTLKVPSIAVVKTPFEGVMKIPITGAGKRPSADTLKVLPVLDMKTPSADAMRVPSITIVKAPPSAASKRFSSGAMKPRTKMQPKNQKKQDKEKYSLSLDLVLINPNRSIPSIQHFPIPEATKVTISGTHVIY